MIADNPSPGLCAFVSHLYEKLMGGNRLPFLLITPPAFFVVHPTLVALWLRTAAFLALSWRTVSDALLRSAILSV